jgi:O-succinylbenzoate synthase
MKLTNIDIFHYRLPLKRALTSGDSAQREREGMLIRLRDDSGAFGWGECAPLPPVNSESIDRAAEQLRQLRLWAIGREMPDSLAKLDGAFNVWIGGLNLAPSVRCAFETACLNMVARFKSLSLSQLLSVSAGDIVKVNALVDLSQPDILGESSALREAGYEAFKLKVGRRTVDEDIASIRALRRVVGDDAVLRLDANQLWTAQALLSVWSEVQQCDIDYFEEPVTDMSGLLSYLDRKAISIPLALDESLSKPDHEKLTTSAHVKALVLKPTALGLERSVELIRKARGLAKKAIISSTFESSIGISALVHIAAAFADRSVAMGLDTGGWLAEDLLDDPAASQGGRFIVDDLPEPPEKIKSGLLTEMLCDE